MEIQKYVQPKRSMRKYMGVQPDMTEKAMNPPTRP